MTTLAANKPRAFEGGELNDFTLVASTKVFEGAAVGLVKASGLARPLQGGDRFGGFAIQTTDSTAGSDFRYYGTLIGFVKRFVSSGVVVVEFDADAFRDPYDGWVHVLVNTNTTIDATHTGKWLWNDQDGVVFTLPAVEGINFVRFGNLAAYGVA